MLFNLLLATLAILLCFSSYFLLFLSVFFTIPVEIESARLKLALAIPTVAQITAANNSIEMLPVVTDKTIYESSKQSKEARYLLSLLLINSLSLISALK